MPIKFPKGFARRKSSGNALEELGPTPEPSFKVFERPHSGSKSFDGSAALKGYINQSGRDSNRNSTNGQEDPYPDNIFAGIERSMTDNTNNNSSNNAMNNTLNNIPEHVNTNQTKQQMRPRMGRFTGSNGSGGTNTSDSSGKLYDDSSSSTKYSSSSTLPSTDASAHDIPVPPIPESPFSFSLRASARTWSFGSKAPKTSPPRAPTTPVRQSQPVSRERPVTASTTSTATPPKLLESDFNIEGSGNLGNIFETYDDNKQQHRGKEPPANPTVQKPAPAARPNPSQKDRPKSKISSSLSPLFGRSKSPLSSTDSQTSRDSLIGSPQDDFNVSQQLVKKLDQATLSDEGRNKDGRINGVNGHSDSRTGLLHSTSPIYEETKPSQYLSPNPAFRKAMDPDETSLFSSDKDFTTVPLNNPKRLNGSSNLTPPALSLPEKRNEPSMSSQATLAARYEEAASQETSAPKVMTPAQFERYREQRELNRQPSNASSQSSVAEESEDDEDEAEKRKKIAMQRKKQEAHLSVYRQQMMKVTGDGMKSTSEKSSSTSERPVSMVEPSPNAANRRSVLDPNTSDTPTAAPAAGSGSGDEDDDIPLAILAAHGFPNRNRPPSQLMMSNSNPNLRSSYHAPGQGAPLMAGDGQTPAPLNKRSSTLPVFARNLPRDPYYGAGLVNQTHRESLALGGGTPSVHGGAAGPPPPGPPGGLVGVIANEERARAMRRGSPNTQAVYDPPNGGFNSQPTVPPSMGHYFGNRDSMMPPDQSQMQVNQQMTQMMQMQMQWMQQMMSFQNSQYGQPSPPMPNPNFPNQNFLQPPGPNQRPNSMLSNGAFPPPRGPFMADQRTFSMVEPPAGQWGHNRPASFIPPLNDMGSFNSPGYAPSVAPSERSNIGAASRYRPVSTIQPNQTLKPSHAHARSSTFTTSTLRAWNEEPGNLAPNAQQPNHTPAAPTIRPVSGLGANTPFDYSNPSPAPRPTPSPVRNPVEDEDDDEGWAEMAKNREKRKKGWRFRKVNSGLDDLYHPPGPENQV